MRGSIRDTHTHGSVHTHRHGGTGGVPRADADLLPACTGGGGGL